MSVAVETVNLTKTYGEVVAVQQLNLQVEEGEIFGFLGPNGAGKTTTILMLLGLTEPTSGQAKVCGYNSTREPLQVKRLAGYLPEKVGFYEDLTAKENLRYIARLNGLPTKLASRKIEEALESVGLSQVGERRVGTFSKGMKQRLGIADVLIKDPRVVFLDEPTGGLDPDGANDVLELIVRMSREQKITVILSSHLLHQVQRICHRVGIMSKGKMVAQGTIDRLGREALEGDQVTVEIQASPLSSQLLDSIAHLEGVSAVEKSGEFLLVKGRGDMRPEISRAVVASNSILLHMKLVEHPLEEIYMRYFREE